MTLQSLITSDIKHFFEKTFKPHDVKSCNFAPLFYEFKRIYGKTGVWKPYVTPYHERGEFALNRPYENALNKVPEDKAD